ncbi:hypothetical protein [Bordetella genomosp. 5]|uniref:hypothetical protein n=1 Tax=Bordetella genomosp. 5 TaxID=1395608 RepID=UPI0011406DC5|nr:hypothetical protein [Bordetella genomosp. 5]
MFRVKGQSGHQTDIPELSLLDPSADIRTEGIRHLANRALPNWPRALIWQERVSSAPLSDSDFELVLEELRQLAQPTLARILQSLQSGGFSISEIIPKATAYYESILGSIPEHIGPKEYAAELLTPHLAAIIAKSPPWALRCLQAVCVTESVDPVAAMAFVSNDDLLTAFQIIGIGVTPFALMVTYELSRARASSDERFSPISREALKHLIENGEKEEARIEHVDLLIKLAQLTMASISQASALAPAPVFWRRLAAFTHATIILETIFLSDEEAHDLTSQLDGNLAADYMTVEMLDHLAEPRWSFEDLSPRQPWGTALLRATDNASAVGLPATQTASQPEELESYCRLLIGLPDIIDGGRRDWALHPAKSLDEDILDPYSHLESESKQMQMFTALAHYARAHHFNESLLSKRAKLSRRSLRRRKTVLGKLF